MTKQNVLEPNFNVLTTQSNVQVYKIGTTSHTRKAELSWKAENHTIDKCNIMHILLIYKLTTTEIGIKSH